MMLSQKLAILDDVADNAHGLAEALKCMGIEAEAFTEVDALIEAAKTTEFKGFVVDWMLGKITSRKAIQTLRGMGYKNTPLFVLTGSMFLPGDDLPDTLKEFSAVARVKPYPPRSLAKDLKNAGLV